MAERGSRTSDYEYDLPAALIAQTPAVPRSASRLLVLHRESKLLEHRSFSDVPAYLQPDDALVINTTRVFRARLHGTRGSGAPAEFLLLRQLGDYRFEAMVHPGGKLKPGRTVTISPELTVLVESTTQRRTRIVRLQTTLPVWEAIERFGHTPLPPYIHRPDSEPDAERYQTVYARERGSVAAPTAGLHFTPELLETIGSSGVTIAEIVLHVGAGTFKPVEADDPALHQMHEERYSIDATTAARLNAVSDSGGRIFAVGTTALRALESNVLEHGRLSEAADETRLFVRPPFTFRIVNGLLTNFHLPRSTLLMLVAAFAGYELTMEAYAEAVRERYRFYSYGDAMLIL